MNRNLMIGSALAGAVLMGASVSVGADEPVSRASRMIATRDNMPTNLTFDQATIDSAGVFLIGQLERFDPQMNAPLVEYTWSRDIDLRTDVSIADEVASWSLSNFAAAGGMNPTGKSWVGKDANSITGIALDLGKVGQSLYLWAMELGYSIPELASSQQMGRPVDQQKLEGINLKHQMDTDEQVYIGDSVLGVYGLLNSPAVAVSNVPNGALGTSTWATKTPNEILADVNAILYASWAASGFSVVPQEMRLPPFQFSLLTSVLVSTAGNMSLMSYIQQNSITLAKNGRALNIQPIKWLTGRGAAGKDRMFVYTKERKRVQFPLVPLQRTPLEYRSLWQMTTYFGRMGSVEWRYPETAAYADGI